MYLKTSIDSQLRMFLLLAVFHITYTIAAKYSLIISKRETSTSKISLPFIFSLFSLSNIEYYHPLSFYSMDTKTVAKDLII